MNIRLDPTTPVDSSRELEIQKKRLRDSCREFESVMISYVMKSMSETVDRAEQPDSARQMYEDMLTAQMSKEMGKNSAMGLGNILYKSLEPMLKAQYGSTHKTAQPEGTEAVARDSTVPVPIEAPSGETDPEESISFKK